MKYASQHKCQYEQLTSASEVVDTAAPLWIAEALLMTGELHGCHPSLSPCPLFTSSTVTISCFCKHNILSVLPWVIVSEPKRISHMAPRARRKIHHWATLRGSGSCQQRCGTGVTDLEVGYSENAGWTFCCDHHEQLAFLSLVAVISGQPYDLAEAHLQEHAHAMDACSF